MKKRFLAVILALALCVGLLPSAAFAADSDFLIKDGVLTVYNGPGGDVVIPDGVTSIGELAFWNRNLTSVTIPDSVTSIENRAFPDNNKLVSVTIPNSVTSIGDLAFSGCTNLTNVTIPSSVTSIRANAFANTPWLKNQGDFPVVNGILLVYQGEGSSVTIPNNVTTIGAGAFSGCESLTNVTIPSSVTSIGDQAFLCRNLTSVTIPSSVTNIGGEAFAGTPWLEGQGEFPVANGILLAYQGNSSSVTIPNSVTSIGVRAFHNRAILTSVTIPDGVTTIGEGAFGSCEYLTSVTIPVSVTSIGDTAFFECWRLKDIYYGGSEEQWKAITVDYSEGGNDILKRVTIHYSDNTDPSPNPGDNTASNFTIENGVLTKYSGSGGAVTIPSSVTSIGERAFYGCEGLTSVTIPSSVTCIDRGAFLGCTGLTSVTIPSSVTYIGVQAFYHTGLTSVNIPSSVTELDGSVFAACWSLPRISVDPNNPNYTSVDGVLFSKDMTVLHTYPAGKQGTAYTIPSSVTSIDYLAFDNCYSLVSVSIPNSVTSIGGSAFGACWRLTSVTIPFSVTSISNYTFSGCLYLTSVDIPSSVTTIGSGAFNNCESLTDVYYGGSEAQWNLIEIGDYNEALETAAIHHSSTLPAIATFSDVKSDGYYLEAVDWAVENGVTTGKTGTTFAPSENCTHGQILTFLWRAAGEPDSDVTLPFETTGNEYYLGAAKWAYENGMIGADFSHKTPCTRADAVNYIWQAFGKETASYDGRFTDVSADSPYAAAVAWAVDNGVTTGATETTFNPSGICNRGQIVTFLYRAYK